MLKHTLFFTRLILWMSFSFSAQALTLAGIEVQSFKG
jgi:hypothetical protein